MFFCSVQDAVHFIDSYQLPVFHLHFCFRNKYWRFYLLTCTTCIVYQYFKELVASVSKAGAKVRGFILTTKLFRKFFFIFSFLLISQTLLRKGKNNHKRKSKTALFANRTAKIKTFIYILQTFSELFLFLSSSGPTLCH